MIRIAGAVLAAPVALVALTGLAGCGAHAAVSIGTPQTPQQVAVSGPKVAAYIKKTLTAKVGQAPDSVTCPHDLPGKVGATIRCTLAAGTSKYGVTVRATSVHGTDVHFNIQVDKKPEN